MKANLPMRHISERRRRSKKPTQVQLKRLLKASFAANEKMVEEFKAGKEAFNGACGQVMKASKGKANPAQVNELMKKLIGRWN